MGVRLSLFITMFYITCPVNGFYGLFLCNELGKGRPLLETGATDDGLSGSPKEHRHNPVMIRNIITTQTGHNR